MGLSDSSLVEDSSGVGELLADRPEPVEVSEPEPQDSQDSLPAADPWPVTLSSERGYKPQLHDTSLLDSTLPVEQRQQKLYQDLKTWLKSA